ncbi:MULTISPECIES: phosphoribosylanthranilate isomerase [Calditerrivibrio]|jgi:phosphoribosylanthranilate isomerase|uniref:N-(5'-phosphoribosyl)anthranilate isomerase n=1 Tax=Calditerrivibrio nitroreducens TaxID=477976 RepID=A0A2J6WG63_9BACT|nr:MAG: hypothetical protein C0187_07480 [Calditerrivibrio nitroreducens]
MFVKVCGITSKEYIDWAIELGFDAIGVVFYPKSKRFVDKVKGIELADYSRGKIATVAVGISYDEIRDVKGYFDYYQISEYKVDKKLIYSIENRPDKEAELYILDKSKGGGVFYEIPEWFYEIRDKTIIAGGLTPENVVDVVKAYSPFGVDVSSGVEISPGIKSKELMRDFIKNLK